jgi:hypothetical protein
MRRPPPRGAPIRGPRVQRRRKRASVDAPRPARRPRTPAPAKRGGPAAPPPPPRARARAPPHARRHAGASPPAGPTALHDNGHSLLMPQTSGRRFSPRMHLPQPFLLCPARPILTTRGCNCRGGRLVIRASPLLRWRAGRALGARRALYDWGGRGRGEPRGGRGRGEAAAQGLGKACGLDGGRVGTAVGGGCPAPPAGGGGSRRPGSRRAARARRSGLESWYRAAAGRPPRSRRCRRVQGGGAAGARVWKGGYNRLRGKGGATPA